MLAGLAPCHRMSGYLFFKSSGLLFPRLTEQHPFTRLPQAMRLRVFDEAHRETSKCLNWLQRSRRTETRILQQIKADHSPQSVGFGNFASQRPTCFATGDRVERAQQRLRLGK
jgi:hypothetical protein